MNIARHHMTIISLDENWINTEPFHCLDAIHRSNSIYRKGILKTVKKNELIRQCRPWYKRGCGQDTDCAVQDKEIQIAFGSHDE